jgi:GGDEF domain-containing protein
MLIGRKLVADDNFEPKVFSLVRPRPRVIRRTLHKPAPSGVVAVVLSDIDHKRMNDTLGHAAGDQVIQRVGQSLQACARDGI